MNIIAKNQRGFGAVEFIVALVVVVAVGGAGWFVWKNKSDTSTPTQASTTTPTASVSNDDAFVNVITTDETEIKQVTPDKIAKTSDQAKILKALHDMCKDPTESYVLVNTVVFDDGPNFHQDGDYAEINASRCISKITSVDQFSGSGMATYLHKDKSGNWVFDFATQMGLECAKIEGKGYPKTIISSCYEADYSIRTL